MIAREALAGEPVWVVGGALRDRLLGLAVTDVDLAVAGDAGPPAKRLARAAGGPAFPLSDAFGGWRVLAGDRSWQVDLLPLRGASIEEDLAQRDLTVNAMAEPLAGGALVDPYGGAADVAGRRLRAVADAAFDDDPLRVVRVARLACELGFEADAATVAAARARAPRLAEVSPERVFAELKRIVSARAVLAGLRRLEDVGALSVVLPELDAMRGIEQTVYHHRDVLGHTLEVLEHTVALQADPAAVVGPEHAAGVTAVLAEPLADDLDRGAGLRWGALLHDAAKPQTQTPSPKGGFGFPGHADRGADVSRRVLGRLRTGERLRSHVAALARHHLRLGYLVHEAPLTRRAVFRYLAVCEPVEVDVTLLSMADRLATRGRKSEEAIARHLALARDVLGDALAWRAAGGRPAPLLRGDELAGELGLSPGPELGRLLEALAEAQYAGEVRTRDEALGLARAALG